MLYELRQADISDISLLNRSDGPVPKIKRKTGILASPMGLSALKDHVFNGGSEADSEDRT